MTLFHTHAPPPSDGVAYLSAMRVAGVAGTGMCAAAALRVAPSLGPPAGSGGSGDEAALVDALIARELTIIFAPKEWQSPG